jgi:hypothetical protein
MFREEILLNPPAGNEASFLEHLVPSAYGKINPS